MKAMEKLGRQTTMNFGQQKVMPLVPQQQIQQMKRFRDTSSLRAAPDNRASNTGLLLASEHSSPDKRSVFEQEQPGDKEIIEELIVGEDVLSSHLEDYSMDFNPAEPQNFHR